MVRKGGRAELLCSVLQHSGLWEKRKESADFVEGCGTGWCGVAALRPAHEAQGERCLLAVLRMGEMEAL